jgi:hypothetical protein
MWVFKLLAVLIYLGIFYAFGFWAAIGTVVALSAFQIYWRITKGVWFE